MSTGALIGIIIAVIVVAAVAVAASPQLRRARVRRKFGPEYDRLAKELGPRKAEAELTVRQRRVEALGIRPLSAEQQARYSGEWAAVQERFVDAPAEAVSAADALIWDVMRDRGYPADDKKASVEALSVYHARPLDGYRQAQDIWTRSASTEELRKAMIRYRTLFEDLLGVPVGQGQLRRAVPLPRGAAATGNRTAATPR
jgi:PAS domain-containing protein